MIIPYNIIYYTLLIKNSMLLTKLKNNNPRNGVVLLEELCQVVHALMAIHVLKIALA